MCDVQRAKAVVATPPTSTTAPTGTAVMIDSSPKETIALRNTRRARKQSEGP